VAGHPTLQGRVRFRRPLWRDGIRPKRGGNRCSRSSSAAENRANAWPLWSPAHRRRAAAGTVQASAPPCAVSSARLARKLNAAQTASGRRHAPSTDRRRLGQQGSLSRRERMSGRIQVASHWSYYCDTTGRAGFRLSPVPHIYDRGLGRLDSAVNRHSIACAFDAHVPPNAPKHVSGTRGRLRRMGGSTPEGAIPRMSAQLGGGRGLPVGHRASARTRVCLARSRYAVNAPGVIGSCGKPASASSSGRGGRHHQRRRLCAAWVPRQRPLARVPVRTCDGLSWQGNGRITSRPVAQRGRPAGLCAIRGQPR